MKPLTEIAGSLIRAVCFVFVGLVFGSGFHPAGFAAETAKSEDQFLVSTDPQEVAAGDLAAEEANREDPEEIEYDEDGKRLTEKEIEIRRINQLTATVRSAQQIRQLTRIAPVPAGIPSAALTKSPVPVQAKIPGVTKPPIPARQPKRTY